jgi:hypothetical protein
VSVSVSVSVSVAASDYAARRDRGQLDNVNVVSHFSRLVRLPVNHFVVGWRGVRLLLCVSA